MKRTVLKLKEEIWEKQWKMKRLTRELRWTLDRLEKGDLSAVSEHG